MGRPRERPRAVISLDSNKQQAPVYEMKVQCFEYRGRTVLDYIEVQFGYETRPMRMRPVVTHADPDTWGYHVELREVDTAKDVSEFVSVGRRRRGRTKAS